MMAIPDTAKAPPGATARWKSRLLAAGLSLLAPGAGHLYLGRHRGCAGYATAMVILSVATAAVQAADPKSPVPAFLFLGLVAVSAVLSVSAVFAAFQAAGETPVAFSRRRLVGAAGIIAGIWAVNGGGYLVTESHGAWRPFLIASGSMEPTYRAGDYILARLKALDGPVERGEIIVFHKETANEDAWVKRVIGLPGDTVQTVGGRLILNGQRLDYAPYGVATGDLFFEKLGAGYPVRLSRGMNSSDGGPFTVPDAHVFVMGDNRPHSIDSRSSQLFGFVPVAAILGQPGMIYWSPDWRRIGRSSD